MIAVLQLDSILNTSEDKIACIIIYKCMYISIKAKMNILNVNELNNFTMNK